MKIQCYLLTMFAGDVAPVKGISPEPATEDRSTS